MLYYVAETENSIASSSEVGLWQAKSVVTEFF